jgi:hypothetical protein
VNDSSGHFANASTPLSVSAVSTYRGPANSGLSPYLIVGLVAAAAVLGVGVVCEFAKRWNSGAGLCSSTACESGHAP